MSDFSELCPLFSTGVYKELYLGSLTTSIYNVGTYNFLSSAGDPAAEPTSLNLGRTVVVTQVWVKRGATATAYTATLCLLVGRRTGSGTATISDFGTICFSMSTAVSQYRSRHWTPIDPTSFTLHTADFLNISCASDETDSGEGIEIIVQYREK